MSCDLVVVLWRPDTTTGRGPPAAPVHHFNKWIGGQWASDRKIYRRNELPTPYRGQPWFDQIANAVAYLTESRDHTACQLALVEFERWFPDVSLHQAT